MFCENCGMKLENGARICPGCGRNIGMQPIPPTFYGQSFQGQQNNTQPVNPMPARRIIFTTEALCLLGIRLPEEM